MRLFLPQPLRPLLLLAVLLLSAGSRLFAQALPWQDASVPGPGFGNSTAFDAAGNTYVTGSFYGTATFGATTLTSAGSDDIFLAKRTPTGAWQWATSVGGNGYDASVDVAVDGSGSVLVTGYFSSPTIAFGTTTLTRAGAGTSDLFVAKLTPTGAWQWATGAGGSNNDEGYSVAVGSNGSVVVTGIFGSPTITFGATTLTRAGAGTSDLFVAKLTPTGVWQWAAGAGGTDREIGYSVAMDSSGSVVVTGTFHSPTIAFGATTLTRTRAADFFVAKLTPTGTWQWATGAGSNDDDRGYGVAMDGSGSVVVTGAFSGPTIAFGAITLTNAGAFDIFVAKLTPTGAWQWATRAGGNNDDNGYGVAVDGSGSVLITGIFGSPTITFGTTTLRTGGGRDVFVAKLTPTGVWQWATSARGTYDDSGNALSVDGSGSVMVTGTFYSPTIAFGATTLANPAPGNSAIFLARLSATTGLPEAPDPAGLTLAPNPARTTVQLTGATGTTATLRDALGRLVGTVPLTQGTATLDVRALPAGLYLLRAGRATRRLVVE